ncbi:MAG: tRNA preQ1(34) S-adenosylmethionine ribosyltransferase-isomerase QueA [Ghiorsea sp.]
MNISDFDFSLPDSLIAKSPLKQRDASRLLQVNDEQLTDSQISDLVHLVEEGDIWVINDTRVIPARLLGQKSSGGKVELLLLEPTSEDNVWLAWGKSNKPLKDGEVITISDGFDATVLSREGKEVRVHLNATNVMDAIEQNGHMPLPPYINRPDTEEDKARYQTVFANKPGAVAAPTAGLHLTQKLMQRMEEAGATFVHVTLHVGPGTFQPVQVENISDHIMHEEAYIISEKAAQAINQAKQNGKRVIAVGTTSLRTLEAASQSGKVKAGANRTDIFITPGYAFKTIDGLLTNFHLPKSTLLMLVSAIAGKDHVLHAYKHAIQASYRFYSYGDAMFVRNNK